MDLDQLKKILDLVRSTSWPSSRSNRGAAPQGPEGFGPALMTLPAAAPANAAGAAARGSACDHAARAGSRSCDSEVELAVVKSPIVGTFYRSPEPGSASFVEIGSTVKKGQVLCIIEAMKLMNEIDSEYEGEIVNVYVENGQPVRAASGCSPSGQVGRACRPRRDYVQKILIANRGEVAPDHLCAGSSASRPLPCSRKPTRTPCIAASPTRTSASARRGALTAT